MSKKRARLPQVCVCVPSGAMVHADFAISLAHMMTYPTPAETSLLNVKSSLITSGRNACVEQVLETLLSHNKDIVGASYFRVVADEETGTEKSEDYVFCEMARKAGYQVWCDVDLTKEIGHIGQQIFKVQQVEK